jgi:hypothetical protein
MRTVLALAASLAAVAAFAGPQAESAFACSCVPVDPARDLEGADAAFVGRALSRAVDEPVGSSADPALWTFAVERAVKGSLPPRMEVTAPVSGASCGLELRLGQRIGLLLERHGEGYQSSLCRQVDPELLARHALPTAEVAGREPDGGDRWAWAGVASGLAVAAAAAVALSYRLRRRRT